MKQKSVFGCLVLLFFISFGGSLCAQSVVSPPSPTPTPAASPTPAPCPRIAVQAQAGRMVRDGQPVNFIVTITGGDPQVVPTIIWSTPGGLITKGQNTRRIEVDTTGAGTTPDRELRAEVWIGGYAPQCLLQASSAVKVIPPATKFVEFGVVDEDVLKKNLDSVSTYFSQSSDNLFVIGYAGRSSERGFVDSWLRRMRETLVTRGVSPRRIAAIDGGFREEPHFAFWIVPSGAEPPRPTPTIKRSEIVFPKTTPKRKP